MSSDGERDVDVALSQNLDLPALLGEPGLTHLRRRHRGASIEHLEALDVHDGELFTVRIAKAFELWHLFDERRLATLKTWAHRAACLETLGPTASGFSTPSGFAAPDADLALLRALRWSEMM